MRFIKNSRRLILISLDWTRPKDPPLSLGHASILANLRQNEVDVIPQSLAVNQPSFSHHAVTDFIMKHAVPDTDVALGAFVWNERATQAILNDLKKYKFPGRIILGGPQISYAKKGLESFYPQADIFIRGYAESALADVMTTDLNTFPSIKGVHYAGKPDLGLSATIKFDTLPSPFLTGTLQPQQFIRWETQRGCPFRCAFCQHRESDISMKRRYFPESRLASEIEWITHNPIIQDIAVLDPTFNSGPNYLNFMDQLIKHRYRGKLALQCRIEMVKDEFLDKIVQLNETAETVLEFGLQTTNRDEQAIIDRPNNMGLVNKVLSQVKKLNIKSEVSLIFGLPKQTIASFQQSIDFCLNHDIPVIHAFPLMLLRGTPLHDRKRELGLVESDEIASAAIDRVQVDIPHVVSSPSFTYDDWKRMAKIAESLERRNEHNKKLSCGKNIVANSIWAKENVASHPIRLGNYDDRLTMPKAFGKSP